MDGNVNFLSIVPAFQASKGQMIIITQRNTKSNQGFCIVINKWRFFKLALWLCLWEIKVSNDEEALEKKEVEFNAASTFYVARPRSLKTVFRNLKWWRILLFPLNMLTPWSCVNGSSSSPLCPGFICLG